MNIIRTIHPVGQGAFYSEKFINDNGNQKIVVYDCGTKKKDGKFLTAELSSYFNEDKVIDLFFCSHFDEDHINGIIHLKKLGVKIKTVVVPLIDKKDTWFYICTGGALTMEAINDPKAFFEADNVISVESVDETHLNENDETNNEEINIEGVDRRIKSGSRMLLSGLQQYWVYIPYNFEEDIRRSQLIVKLKEIEGFNDEAKQRKCSVEELLHDEEFIGANYTKINKAYKGVCDDGSNRCSLVVYSGPIMRSDILVRFFCCGRHIWCGCRLIGYEYRLNGCGCLYLGDTDLNQGRGRNNKILKQLEKFLSNCIDEIGSIQLPHHGSIKNFNKLLLSFNDECKLFFASFGNGNTYGHPSFIVFEQIINSDNIFCGVNENRRSALVEHIRLR